jgi:hypothetical protein
MTIQSRMNERVQRLHRRGLTPSEWAANLSNKTPEELNKNPKPNGSYQLLAHMQMQRRISIIAQDCP